MKGARATRGEKISRVAGQSRTYIKEEARRKGTNICSAA
jgi:hypothetical protein